MTLPCPHCGREIHLHAGTKPLPTTFYQTMDDLSLSSRAIHCLHVMGIDDTSPVVAILAIEHAHRFKNFGKGTYMEIVAALEAEAGCSREEITKSIFWKTASIEFRNTVDTVRFRLRKEDLEGRQAMNIERRSEGNP